MSGWHFYSEGEIAVRLNPKTHTASSFFGHVICDVVS